MVCVGVISLQIISPQNSYSISYYNISKAEYYVMYCEDLVYAAKCVLWIYGQFSIFLFVAE